MPSTHIVCRIRPPTQGEIVDPNRLLVANRERSCVGVPPDDQYHFDGVFDNESSPELSQSILQRLCGKDAVVLLYGPTGAGKTTTLCESKTGLLDTFLDSCAESITSFCGLEMYNGHMRELVSLVENPLKVRHHVEEALRLRVVGKTDANQRSSRSHLLLQFKLESGKRSITFVDLAGCERLEQSGQDPLRRAEAIHVNKSLTALRDVVEQMATHRSFISYRNSILTQTLSDTMREPNSILCMVLCVPPYRKHAVDTLRFGRSATRIEKAPVIPRSGALVPVVMTVEQQLALCKQELEACKKELAILKRNQAWISFVSEYRAAHPGITYKQALMDARLPYAERKIRRNPEDGH